jgi:hypothetical protein
LIVPPAFAGRPRIILIESRYCFLYFHPTQFLPHHLFQLASHETIIPLLAPFPGFSVFLTAEGICQQPMQSRPTRGWLTVDTIMRDSKWVGASPSRMFLSEDGEYLYFELGQGTETCT